jgi:modulator of FtsH protease
MVEGWENFFVAQVGASAALAGLVFVGISINLTKIMQYPNLPGRALEAIMLLVVVLIESSMFLIPGQSPAHTGALVLVVGLVAWLSLDLVQRDILGKTDAKYRGNYLTHLVTGQVAVLAFVVAGGSMLLRGADGVYWVVPAVVGCYLGAIITAWVLLIEINR